MHQINSSNENNKNNIAQQNHNNQQIQMKPLTNDNMHSIINSKTTTSDLINDINNHLNITNLHGQNFIDKNNINFQPANYNPKPINETSRNLVLNNFAKMNASTAAMGVNVSSTGNTNSNVDSGRYTTNNYSSQKLNNNNNNHLYQNNQNNQSNGSLNAMDIASPSSSVISNEHNLQGYLNQNHILLQNGSTNGFSSSNVNHNINQNYIINNKQNNYFIKNNPNLNGNYNNSK